MKKMQITNKQLQSFSFLDCDKDNTKDRDLEQDESSTKHVSSAASNLGGIVTLSRSKIKLIKNIDIKLLTKFDKIQTKIKLQSFDKITS